MERLFRVYKTDSQTNMAKSTQYATLIIYIYTLFGLRRFFLAVTNFVTIRIVNTRSLLT